MTSPRSLLLCLAALLVSLFAAADADACGGAIMRDIDGGTAKLRDAESALEEGDLRYARLLSAEVLASSSRFLLAPRASRIQALAYARDRRASSSELATALDGMAASMNDPELRSPSLEADWGEVAARVPGKQDEALRMLSSLADRDLMGSPHAYAALARLAEDRGDGALATSARARCTTIATDAAVCGRELRRAPMLRLYGEPAGYAAPAGVLLALLAARTLRARRARKKGVDETGRSVSAPWIGHAARAQTVAFFGVATFAMLQARSPSATFGVAAVVALASLVFEKRAFFRDVRRGKVAGYALRETIAEDEAAPVVLFHVGPRTPETLERVREDAPDGGYRSPARAPLLRVVPRPRHQTLGLVVGFACLAFVAAPALLFLSAVGVFGG